MTGMGFCSLVSVRLTNSLQQNLKDGSHVVVVKPRSGRLGIDVEFKLESVEETPVATDGRLHTPYPRLDALPSRGLKHFRQS